MSQHQSAQGQPLVTVILLARDHGACIDRCIESVLGQQMGDLELIILDDHSCDGSADRARAYLTDPRVRLIVNECREGEYESTAKAYASGTGRYLSLLPAQDFFTPGHLKALTDALEAHPECDLAYSDYYLVDDDARVLGVANHPGHAHASYDGGRNESADLLAYGNYIPRPTALIRRDALATLPMPAPEAAAAGDWDLLIRLASRNSNFCFIKTPSVGRRIGGDHGSQPRHGMDEPLAAHLGILERVLQGPGRDGLADHTTPIWNYLQTKLNTLAPGDDADLEARLVSIRNQLDALGAGSRPMDEAPLVTVIVPTKDRPALLQDALASIVAQDYDRWEAIVINDGGMDVGPLVTGADPWGRIRYLQHRRNRGLPAARNTGLRLSRGEIICYLDDDDRFLPRHLSTAVAALKEPGALFAYTDAEYVTETPGDTQRVGQRKGNPYAHDDFSKERLHVLNYIPVNTWAHRRSLLGQCGLFDEGLSALEDWDLLLRFSRATECVHVRRTTAEVWIRENSQDNMSQREFKNCTQLIPEIYSRYDDLGLSSVRTGREHALQTLAADLGADDHHPQPADDRTADGAYRKWMARHALTESDAHCMAERMMTKWQHNPAIHLIAVLQPGQEAGLAQTLADLAGQLYSGWGLTVFSALPCPEDSLQHLDMIEWIQASGDVTGQANQAIRDTGADWVALLSPGDRLEPHLLFSCADHINRHPGWRFIYVDEDVVDADGHRADPRFKPDFNAELLRSTPYIGAFCLVHREALDEAGGLVDRGGMENYDIAFRLLERWGEDAMGHIPEMLYHRLEANEGQREDPARTAAGRAVVADHLARCGVRATVAEGLLPGSHFVDYPCDDEPLVSIIIPTKDQADLLRTCVSGLLEKTLYSNYELLIVDNGTTETGALDYMRELEAGHPNVRVLAYPHPYNYSAMNNGAARQARGEYLLLLNNDTVIVQDCWLTRLMAHARRPEVGAVGPRLVFPDQTIQHAGIVLGMGPNGVGEHPFCGMPMHAPGLMGRAQMTQNYSAVTGACLLMRRSVFDQVGGLDAEHLAVLFNDVDLCLKVREAGYKIVWTPHATVVHLGSASLRELRDEEQVGERTQGELATMLNRWLPHLAHDPAYNRRLSLMDRDCRPDVEVDVSWNPDVETAPRILAGTLGHGALPSRLAQPLHALHDAARARVALLPRPMTGFRRSASSNVRRRMSSCSTTPWTGPSTTLTSRPCGATAASMMCSPCSGRTI